MKILTLNCANLVWNDPNPDPRDAEPLSLMPSLAPIEISVGTSDRWICHINMWSHLVSDNNLVVHKHFCCYVSTLNTEEYGYLEKKM